MPRVILITGAARGIGAEISKLFLENDDIVYINYKDSEEEAFKFKNKYSKAIPIKCDITKENEIREMVDIIKTKSGKIDVLINNAGIAIDTEVDFKTKDNFIKILDTNLVAPFLIVKYASKIMSKGSNIINISSTNGIDTNYYYSLDYDASKAGLISLTNNLADYLAPNIRVNTIAPGWVNTNMNINLDKEYKENECKKILLGRFADPKEIAEVVFFVASSKASYINKAIIRVDGGNK